MSDVEEILDVQDNYNGDQSHQACYIYRPFISDAIDDRPKKKRKTQHAAQDKHTLPPRLLHGDEPEFYSSQRLEQWKQIWEQRQEKIDQLIAEADRSILTEVVNFVEITNTSGSDGRLPTGLVVFGPDSGVQDRLLRSWKALHSDSTSQVLIQLRASSCPNLQTALRNTIKNVIIEVVGLDSYTAFLARNRRLVPMNFDLELLQLFVREQNLHKVVVSVADVETFDTVILSQLLWSLSAWSQRIPFVALLGIATTVELFESRLPKSAVEILDTSVFLASSKDDLLYKAFEIFQHAEDAQLQLGPLTISSLHEASQSQSTTIETFTNILKVTYLSHYFSNALCVLSDGFSRRKQDEPLLCRAIRNTESFRQHCEDLLEIGKAARSSIEKLLNDDVKCLETSIAAIATGQASLRTLSTIIASLKDLYRNLGLRRDSAFKVDLELYNHSEDLTSAEIFDEIIMTIESLPRSKLLTLFTALDSTTIATLKLQEFHIDFQNSEQRDEDSHLGSPTKDRLSNSTRKSPHTKNQSKKAQSIPSSAGQSYNTVLNALTTHLFETARSHQFSFSTLMNEAFVINARQPLLSIVTPRPRQILERALGKPADYLGCECEHPGRSGHTRADDNTMRNESRAYHAAPPTSVLYTLLQEAGTVINVRDLFEAFQSRLDPSTLTYSAKNDDGEAEVEGENGILPANGIDNDIDEDKAIQKSKRLILCMFYQSLAELKMLGMVKSSTSTMIKKRALALEGSVNLVGRGKRAYAEIDFIAKTSWAGL